MPSLLQGLHVFAAAYMTGIIWFVQVIHYPSLAPTANGTFESHHQDYTRRMGFIVGPVMILEMGLQLFMLLSNPSPIYTLGFVLLIIIWISTFALQVPRHNKLCQGFDPEIKRALVQTNWIRTFAWTARSALLLAAI